MRIYVAAVLTFVIVANLVNLERAPNSRRAWYGVLIVAAVVGLLILAIA